MLKKILISVLSAIIIMIIIMGTVRYFLNISGDYMLPPGGLLTHEDRLAAAEKNPEYIFALEDADNTGLSAIVGTFNNKNGIYYSIFDKNGNELTYGELGTDSKNFKLYDLRCSSREFDLLCMSDGKAALYSVSDSVSGSASKSVNDSVSAGGKNAHAVLKTEIQDLPQIEEICGMFIPDAEMAHILIAGHSSAVLYDIESEKITAEYKYDYKSIISSAVYNNDGMLVLCGAASDDTGSNSFSYGFAEAYSKNGNMIWSRRLLNQKDCVSAAMECQTAADGSICVYGRYFDYSSSDIILSYLPSEKYDELKLYGHGADYYIYTSAAVPGMGENVPSSAFITKLSPEGEITDTKVYSALNDYVVPSILHEKSLNKLDANGEFILAVSRAQSDESKTYHITAGGASAEIPSDIKVMYSIDTKGGVYAYMAESSANVYRMKYFTSMDEFAGGMTELRKSMRVFKIMDNIPRTAFAYILLTGSLIIITAKNRWR